MGIFEGFREISFGCLFCIVFFSNCPFYTFVSSLAKPTLSPTVYKKALARDYITVFTKGALQICFCLPFWGSANFFSGLKDSVDIFVGPKNSVKKNKFKNTDFT